MRRMMFVLLARTPRRASPLAVAAVTSVSLASLVIGCATTPSLVPEQQARAIRERDRALASHADAIQTAIKQSGKMGALAFLDAGDGHLVVVPGDTPADAWAHHTGEAESATGRTSVPAVVTFVHRADVPKAPETLIRADLEREQAARASAATLEAELRDTHRRIDERLTAIQRELADSIAAARQETTASLGAARADLQKALGSFAEDLEAVRKFMLQTAQLAWLNNELTTENAGGIRKLATASQELSASSARLQETMRQLSENVGGQLKELANRLDALQGKVTSLR